MKKEDKKVGESGGEVDAMRRRSRRYTYKYEGGNKGHQLRLDKFWIYMPGESAEETVREKQQEELQGKSRKRRLRRGDRGNYNTSRSKYNR